MLSLSVVVAEAVPGSVAVEAGEVFSSLMTPQLLLGAP
jgi:hypothetical protein